MPWTQESTETSPSRAARSTVGHGGSGPPQGGSRVATSIVVPMRDEATRVEVLVGRLIASLEERGESFELVLVDDGSRDGTAACIRVASLQDPRVRSITLPSNRGKGAAVRAGMLGAKGERRVFLDADLSAELCGLDRVLDALIDGADFAFGDRRHPESSLSVRQPRVREWLGRGFRGLARVLTGGEGVRNGRDLTCGLKGFRGGAAEAVFARSRVDRWAFDAEIFTIVGELGFGLAPVPVHWSHRGPSHVRLPRDAFRAWVDLIRIARFRRHGHYAWNASELPVREHPRAS